MPMLTQSLGVPSIAQVGQPKPRSAGGAHGAVTGFRGADPALLAGGRGDEQTVAGGGEGVDEFVEEDGVETVVVGDEQMHAERPWMRQRRRRCSEKRRRTASAGRADQLARVWAEDRPSSEWTRRSNW